MLKKILRFLIIAISLSLILGVVVMILGLILKWKTSTLYSNGFFYAGVLMIGIGFVNVWGMRNQSANPAMPASRMFNLNTEEGFRQLMADISRGYSSLAYLGVSGLLLFGMAALVARLF